MIRPLVKGLELLNDVDEAVLNNIRQQAGELIRKESIIMTVIANTDWLLHVSIEQPIIHTGPALTKEQLSKTANNLFAFCYKHKTLQIDAVANSRKERLEVIAKKWEDKLPSLAKALRSEDLHKSLDDMDRYDGWIRVISSPPPKDEPVLITNGQTTLKACHDGTKWSVESNATPPVTEQDIIAWRFMPEIPDELIQ